MTERRYATLQDLEDVLGMIRRNMPTTRLMTVQEVADRTPWGPDVIRRACRATDPKSVPPPLRAKRGPRGQFVVREQDFQEWIDSFPEV